MKDTPVEVFTVGHSNYSLDDFIALLRSQGITAVADVRSSPYSRYTPQFGREALRSALNSAQIAYVFLGRELGARSDDPGHYVEGKVNYRALRESVLFQQGVERVLGGVKKYRLTLMCAEKEPLECHRTLLVAPELIRQGVKVTHIRDGGSLESHEECMERLLLLTGMGSEQDDLFMSKEELVAAAVERQSERVAWVDESLISGGA